MGRPDEDDENVLAAFGEGRSADDIMLFDCPHCGAASYYNGGSHATCRECGDTIFVTGEDDEDFQPYSMADYWEWEDGGYPEDDPHRSDLRRSEAK